jgi:hypothetical protein
MFLDTNYTHTHTNGDNDSDSDDNSLIMDIEIDPSHSPPPIPLTPVLINTNAYTPSTSTSPIIPPSPPPPSQNTNHHPIDPIALTHALITADTTPKTRPVSTRPPPAKSALAHLKHPKALADAIAATCLSVVTPSTKNNTETAATPTKNNTLIQSAVSVPAITLDDLTQRIQAYYRCKHQSRAPPKGAIKQAILLVPHAKTVQHNYCVGCKQRATRKTCICVPRPHSYTRTRAHSIKNIAFK